MTQDNQTQANVYHHEVTHFHKRSHLDFCYSQPQTRPRPLLYTETGALSTSSELEQEHNTHENSASAVPTFYASVDRCSTECESVYGICRLDNHQIASQPGFKTFTWSAKKLVST